VFVVTEALAEEITGFHVHRGALASIHREIRHRVADLLHLRRLVVLEDIVDHANVGAILRCAAGLGWDGALLAPRAADPLYRRSVKVSMGAVFSLPWARLDDWQSAPRVIGDAGFTTVALTLADDAVDVAAFRDQLEAQPRPVAVLLGTEGAGLSEHWSHSADVAVKIAMHAGIDSLNVAAAAAIACYMLSEPESSCTRGVTGQSTG
jgi:tRNA G18 (ribose-2'-O)-methylase SpoU